MADDDTPSFIAPLEITLELDATTLVVRPACVEQLAKLLAAARPAVRAVLRVRQVLVAARRDVDVDVADPTAAADLEVAGQVLTEDDVVEIYTALAEHPQALLEMVAILTGMPRVDVGRLLPDRFGFLFATVLQVNADFFARAAPVWVAARRALQGLQASPAATGNGPSAS